MGSPLDLSGIVPVVERLLLTDTIRVSTPAGGQPVFDPATGQYAYPEGAIIYEGRGAVQVSGAQGLLASIPGTSQPWVTETSARFQLFTPLAAPVPQRDHVVTVVQVHPGGDVALIGRRWHVSDDAAASTHGVLRITPLDQIQDGDGSTT